MNRAKSKSKPSKSKDDDLVQDITFESDKSSSSFFVRRNNIMRKLIDVISNEDCNLSTVSVSKVAKLSILRCNSYVLHKKLEECILCSIKEDKNFVIHEVAEHISNHLEKNNRKKIKSPKKLKKNWHDSN